MLTYLLQRIAYTLPIILGVYLLTFSLFFLVNTPDDMARLHLGFKYVTPHAIQQWKISHGYEQPLFYNSQAKTKLHRLTHTLFVSKLKQILCLQFGLSDQGNSINQQLRNRIGPSLALALPSLILGVIIYVFFAALMVLFHNTAVSTWGIVFCIVLMSISGLFYIIFGQYLFGNLLRVVPVSGYTSGYAMLSFLLLPVLVNIAINFGTNVRWYRALLLEELSKDYIQTATAKGLSPMQILFKHVLRNALIPILTGITALIPSLLLGNLLIESFFNIPGLGSYTIDAIQQQDFSVVQTMVFLGTMVYVAALIVTDVIYLVIDPRICFTRK